jgi:uncharacterized protein with NRDE domain
MSLEEYRSKRNRSVRTLSSCMCLVLIALDSHPDYSLIVAANRDEFYDRPTAPAGFWADAPSVLAGRDLKAGGTWLGVDRRGRLAAVTNYRQGERECPAPRSRGRLVSDFLTADTGAPEYIERVRSDAGLYNGFNLIAVDAGGLFYYSNREGRVRNLGPGVYGLSNHLLDTPWPKVVSMKSAFGALLNGGASELTADLFGVLSDRDRPGWATNGSVCCRRPSLRRTATAPALRPLCWSVATEALFSSSAISVLEVRPAQRCGSSGRGIRRRALTVLASECPRDSPDGNGRSR